MTGSTRGLRALTLALLVGLTPLTLAVVPTIATTGNDHPADEPDTDPYDGSYTPGTPYAVTQGDTCVVVEPLGDGSTSVVDAYKYRKGQNASYSAYGFSDLQTNQGSQLFLYEGSGGTSLVMLHDRLYGSDGGVVSFEFDGLPTDAAAEWVVKDDFYDGPTNYDRFDVGGSSATIDWTWQGERTDGAAFVGMEDGDYDAVTLTPRFNEEAYYWGSSVQDGTTDELTSWTLRSGDGSTRDLDMDAPLSIRRGTCSDDGPSAALSASTETADPGESVSFDASGSTGSAGVSAYHWDFDGDGEIDDTTASPTATFQYADEGEYTASVTVEDRAGHTATASTTIAVEGEPAPVTAALTLDRPEPRTGQELTFDAGDSAGPVTEYRWSFGDDSGTTSSAPSVTHTYAEPGTYTVTLVAVGEDGQTAETTRSVTVESTPTPARPPTDENDGASGPTRMAFVADQSDDSLTTRFYNPSVDDGFTATFSFGTGPLEMHSLHVEPTREVEKVDTTVRLLDGNPVNESVPTDGTPTFVHLDGTDGPYDSATMTFSLARSGMSDPEDVTVFAREGETWTTVETNVIGSNDDRVWFEVDAPVGTTLAFATAPHVEVDSVEKSTYGLLTGESVTVTATLSNAGNVSWDQQVAFAVDDETTNETTVSLDPDEETTVTRSYTFDTPGIHTISVNGESVTVLVIGRPSSTAASENEQSSEARANVPFVGC